MKQKLLTKLIVFVFLFSACAPATTPSPKATKTEEPIETEAVVEIQPEVDECLACHTDKQRLIDTASQVEKDESESTGVG